MEIIAIDDGDTTGFMECVTTIAEVTFDSLPSFVENVCRKLDGAFISLLHIQVHGDTTAVDFGRDTLDLEGLKDGWRGTLAELTPLFSGEDPWVHLRACEIGQHVALLQNLAGLWGATVCAGRGSMNNVLDVNTGRYVVVRPDGTSDMHLFQPEKAKYRSSVVRPIGWSKWKGG